jgi:anion-transporting  ArsA/GET3 family ATPase
VSAADALIDLLPRTTLVVGKGGVGKTTCAAGLAATCAHRGERTLLVSTDPAAALGSVLEQRLGSKITPVSECEGLSAWQLSAPTLRQAFLDRWRTVIAEIVDRGTYLDREGRRRSGGRGAARRRRDLCAPLVG